jgi:hypothetical protein
MPPTPTAVMPPTGVPFDPSTLFRSLSAPTRRRIVLAAWGDKDTGKTHLSLTFPDPIYLLNLDMGADDLAHKFPGKDIVHAPIAVEDPTDVRSTAEALQRLALAWKWALGEADKHNGTVVLDTVGQAWSWVQAVKLAEVRNKKYRAALAKVGGDESKVDYENIKLMQFEFNEANTWMASFLRRGLAHETANVVFLAHAQPAYDASGNQTNRLVPRWFKETPNIAPNIVQTYRDAQGQYCARIEKLRADGQRVGLMIPGLSHATLDTLIHPK